MKVDNVVGWFEIYVKDIEKAKAFYSQVFGFEKYYEMTMDIGKIAGFENKMGGTGTTDALVQSGNRSPNSNGTLVYFSCEDCEIELNKAQKLGSEITLKKSSIGEHGFIAHFEDCDGNIIGLHSTQ